MKHKTALVTALSIAGVMLAGMAALATNVGILDAASGVGELSAAAAAETPTTAASTPSPSPTDGDVVAYRIEDIGIVTLARQDDELTLHSVVAGAWGYRLDSEGTELAITFMLDDQEVRFGARVEGGQTVVDVQRDAPGGTTPADAAARGDRSDEDEADDDNDDHEAVDADEAGDASEDHETDDDD